MNNTELENVADTLHKVRVMRRGAGLAQFYNMWCWYCGEFWVHVKEKMGQVRVITMLLNSTRRF